MARDGSNIYSPPAGSTATAGTTIESAKYNALIADIAADLNLARPIVAGGTGATTAAAALVNLGLTATAAELNTLDGITATVTELNTLDGITATTAELNTLDGITATVTELNLMNGFAAVETTATDVTTAFPNSRALFRGRGWTYAVAQATTSGSAIDFTGIPSWVTEIKLILNAVSLSSTGDLAVQLGDAGGFETTGYTATSASLTDAGAVAVEEYTTAFGIIGNNAAASFVGEVVFTKYSGNTWASSHSLRRGSTTVAAGGGIKDLSDTLTQVRLTRIGADTFDAGAVIAAWR